jgi:hypothetical protein
MLKSITGSRPGRGFDQKVKDDGFQVHVKV